MVASNKDAVEILSEIRSDMNQESKQEPFTQVLNMALDHALKGCELFFEMYDDEVHKMLKSQTVHNYQVGEKIINTGDKGNQVFILLEGFAEIQKIGRDGKSIKVEKLKTGEVFGLLMILDEKPYGIDIIAKTRCSVLEIKHESIMAQFDRNPRVFGLLMLNISRIIAKRLRSAHSRMGMLKAS